MFQMYTSTVEFQPTIGEEKDLLNSFPTGDLRVNYKSKQLQKEISFQMLLARGAELPNNQQLFLVSLLYVTFPFGFVFLLKDKWKCNALRSAVYGEFSLILFMLPFRNTRIMDTFVCSSNDNHTLRVFDVGM